MAEKQPYLDFELCRKILMRLEEVLLAENHPGVRDFQFEGYDVEMIEYNIMKLHGSYLVGVLERTDWMRGSLRHWPTNFVKRGLEFLAASKDEKAWTEAIAIADGMYGPSTLKMLKGVLLDGDGRETQAVVG